MLIFDDGTRVAIAGLHETLSELLAEGRQATATTAEEIVARLEARGNYIPTDYVVRREYRQQLLERYRDHLGEERRD